MARFRLLLPAVAASAALFVTSCGVTANTTAATVGGEDIPIDDVTTLVESPAFNGGAASDNESTQQGDVARAALQFLIMRQVWVSEAERWDLQIDDDLKAQVGEQLDQQTAQSGQEPLEGRLRELAIDYGVAQQLVIERVAAVDASNEADLRRMYDSTRLSWRQVCLTVVEIPVEAVERAQDALEDGATVDDLTEDVEGVEKVADPTGGCYTEAELIPELRDDMAGARTRVSRGVVLVGDDSSGRVGYAYRIESRKVVPFSEAREELAELVASFAEQGAATWGIRLALSADVNQRYGSGVARGSNGFVVLPPERPELPRSQVLDQVMDAVRAVQGASAGSADTGSAGSGSVDSGAVDSGS